MTQKGTHTWDINITYYRCPQCKYIFEDRQKYIYQLGKYIKNVECSKCHHQFSSVKQSPPSVAPLIGDPQPIETEWGDPA